MVLMKSGRAKRSCCSSFGTFSYNPLATCTRVSKPTTSTVLKVADFGLPITGPVSLSTSSIVIPISFTVWNKLMMEKIPTRLPTKAGVSFARTAFLPRNFSPYISRNSKTSFEVSFPGIISNNLKYLGGLKK